MSRLGLNTTQMLSRYGRSWIQAGPAVALAPIRSLMAAPLCQSMRQISTTRPKKAQATKEAVKGKATAAPKETAAKAKASAAKTKKASTKATAAAKDDPAEAKATPAKKTASAKSKTTASTSAAKKTAAKTTATTKKTGTAAATPASAAVAPVPVASTRATPPTNASSTPVPSAATPASSSQVVKPVPAPPATPNAVPLRASVDSKPPIDGSSPEYKRAARRWRSTIVALPILIVTSYFLFERLAFGKNSSLEEIRAQIRDSTASDDAKASGPE